MFLHAYVLKTGEQLFSAETVERIQQLISGNNFLICYPPSAKAVNTTETEGQKRIKTHIVPPDHTDCSYSVLIDKTGAQDASPILDMMDLSSGSVIFSNPSP